MQEQDHTAHEDHVHQIREHDKEKSQSMMKNKFIILRISVLATNLMHKRVQVRARLYQVKDF
jgi:hypothetical protein